MPVDFNFTQIDEFLHSDYKTKYLEYEDIHEETVMLGVHFNVTDSALDYTCYYNQQLLDEYHSVKLDRVKSRMYPFTNFSYSPYGFSVQIAIESQFLNKKYDYSLGRTGRKIDFNIKIIPYHISFYFSLAILATLNQILISKIRRVYINSIRQIRIKDV